MPTCRELMTRDPVYCVLGDTVDKAARLMKLQDVGPVPVVDSPDSRRLVGIVTDRDLAVKVVADGLSTTDTRVDDVMTPDPVTCRPEDDVSEALKAMEEHQVRRILIVEEGGRTVGIIAQADIAKKVEPARTGEMLSDISKPNL